MGIDSTKFILQLSMQVRPESPSDLIEFDSSSSVACFHEGKIATSMIRIRMTVMRTLISLLQLWPLQLIVKVMMNSLKYD